MPVLVLGTPRVGVIVQEDAEVDVPLGTAPATTVLEMTDAFVWASFVTLLNPARVGVTEVQVGVPVLGTADTN